MEKSKNPEVEIGIGLPEFSKYIELINSVEILRKNTINLKFYLVKENGEIKLM